MKQAYVSVILVSQENKTTAAEILRIDSFLSHIVRSHEIIVVDKTRIQNEDFESLKLSGPLTVILTKSDASRNELAIAGLGRSVGDFVLEWLHETSKLESEIVMGFLSQTDKVIDEQIEGYRTQKIGGILNNSTNTYEEGKNACISPSIPSSLPGYQWRRPHRHRCHADNPDEVLGACSPVVLLHPAVKKRPDMSPPPDIQSPHSCGTVKRVGSKAQKIGSKFLHIHGNHANRIHCIDPLVSPRYPCNNMPRTPEPRAANVPPRRRFDFRLGRVTAA